MHDHDHVRAARDRVAVAVVQRLPGCGVAGDPVDDDECRRSRTGLRDLAVQLGVLVGDPRRALGERPR